ncbi:MAG: DUF1573 domain-containing protein [Chloroflexi bacterium]|nr:DUF1573 domain-containing protein [Chloroflexota bacterium]
MDLPFPQVDKFLSDVSVTGGCEVFWSRLVRVAIGFLLVPFLVEIPIGAASSPADSADAVEIHRIKQRAGDYFTAVGSRRFEQARQFILPASRKDFDPPRSTKASVIGFSILGVELEEGKRSAIIEVEREVVAAVVAGRVKVSKKFRWKLEAGQWFLDPNDPPRTDADIFKEYYYAKRGQDTAAKFEDTVYDFDWAAQGDLVRPRFSFRNAVSQDLVIEKIYGPEWLLDKTPKLHIPAGSSGEIVMEFDTSGFKDLLSQDVFVQFEPVKEMVKLRVRGRVFTAEDIANSPSLTKEIAERKAAESATP